ncbi:hypothetical protein [Streptomyces sp. NPDC088794]|uniref:hypothetical protein n=1 Tax=Streptomyces sp. NPDC088794 TaxID=3365902 RepID=UPI003821DDEA
MTTTQAWPFGTDAIQHDPLTALRIPVVTSFNPMWKYVAAYIDVDRSRFSWGSQERPTDAEASMLASFIEEDRHPGPLPLEQVMDRRHTICDEPMAHWLAWKADHPDIFPARKEA